MDLRTIQERRITKIREAQRVQVKGQTGFDPECIEWDDPSLSVLKLREACYTSRKAVAGMSSMREANAESSFGALLRAGVNNFMFDAYQMVPTIYQDLVRVASSNKYEELYAPLYNSELPQEVFPSEPFDDSRIIGLDVHVRNRKFGRMLAFERELVDDDMTGQITQRAANLGEMMRYVEELQVMIALESAINPQTGGPGYTFALGTALQTPGALSQPNLELADIQLQNMVDPLGNFMLVAPDTVLVSPADKFNILKLLNSTLQPSIPGAAGSNLATSNQGGQTGWTMTVNPLQGEYAAKVSRFLPGSSNSQGGPGLKGPGQDGAHGSWFLLQTKKSIVFQDRDALEVLQEAPNSGTSFSFDQYRYRVRRRFAVRVIDPRTICLGN